MYTAHCQTSKKTACKNKPTKEVKKKQIHEFGRRPFRRQFSNFRCNLFTILRDDDEGGGKNIK
jgi:hypothetical protein